MENIEHKNVKVNGLSMHIAELGTGPLVLFLHGFPDLWYCWRHQMIFMADHGYRAVAPDLRGYGETTGAPVEDSSKFTTLHAVGDIIGLLQAIAPDEEKVFVVGHDWGAMIAWHLCLFRPDKVKALVNLSVPFMPRYPSTNKLDALRILGQCLFRLDKFKALVKFSVALILPRNPWILVGHALRIAWNMLLFRPDNVKHLVNSCVPFVQRNPSINLVDALRIAYGDDYYICKFQIPGEIEAELDRMGVENFMKRMLTYRTPGPLFFPNDKGFVGGGSPDPDTRVDLPSWLNEEDVAYYVSKFEKTGFTGGINYYRALNLTWQLTAAWNGAEAKIPAKFVIGDLDLVYHMPGIQDYIHKGGFKSDVPLLKEVVVIKDAAHFINQEIPDEINKHIYDFIRQF